MIKRKFSIYYVAQCFAIVSLWKATTTCLVDATEQNQSKNLRASSTEVSSTLQSNQDSRLDKNEIQEDFESLSSAVDKESEGRKLGSCNVPSTIIDPGYVDEYRGWYDANGCGTCNQYCRWVGNSGSGGDPSVSVTHGSSLWSCHTAEEVNPSFNGPFTAKKCFGKGSVPPCSVQMHSNPKNPSGQGLRNWNEGQAFCQAQGGPGSRLAAYHEICPDGQNMPALYGQEPGDEWIAIDNSPNEWLNIGDWFGRTCLTHMQGTGENPGWGKDSGKEWYESNFVYCYQCPGSGIGPSPNDNPKTRFDNSEGITRPLMNTINFAMEFSLYISKRTPAEFKAIEDEWTKQFGSERIHESNVQKFQQWDNDKSMIVDQSMVGKVDGVCYAAFSLTTGGFTDSDWLQSLDATLVGVSIEGYPNCNAHRGFHSGYVNGFRDELDAKIYECLNSCGSSGQCPFVLTGGSQGGGISAVTSLYWRHKDPFVITFGAPRAVSDGCTAINPNNHLRFVNLEYCNQYGKCPDSSIKDYVNVNSMLYDSISMLPIPGLSHYGHSFLLGGHETNKQPAYLGLNDNLIRVGASFMVTHSVTAYKEKPASMFLLSDNEFPLRTNLGWKNGQQCGYNDECASKNCAKSRYDKVWYPSYCQPCTIDGNTCLPGTTCNDCCSGTSEYWVSKLHHACGKAPECMPDGTQCGLGTTCNNCCAGKASWWHTRVFTACGDEPSCHPDGTVCGRGTTCNQCCSNHYEYWPTKAWDACGVAPSCIGQNDLCWDGVGETCSNCCSGGKKECFMGVCKCT